MVDAKADGVAAVSRMLGERRVSDGQWQVAAYRGARKYPELAGRANEAARQRYFREFVTAARVEWTRRKAEAAEAAAPRLQFVIREKSRYGMLVAGQEGGIVRYTAYRRLQPLMFSSEEEARAWWESRVTTIPFPGVVPWDKQEMMRERERQILACWRSADADCSGRRFTLRREMLADTQAIEEGQARPLEPIDVVRWILTGLLNLDVLNPSTYVETKDCPVLLRKRVDRRLPDDLSTGPDYEVAFDEHVCDPEDALPGLPRVWWVDWTSGHDARGQLRSVALADVLDVIDPSDAIREKLVADRSAADAAHDRRMVESSAADDDTGYGEWA